VPRFERRVDAQVVEHELQAVVEEEVGALERRRLAAQAREQLRRLADARQADERDDALRQPRYEPDAHGGDHAQGFLAADQ
jgi:hypothetical protein